MFKVQIVDTNKNADNILLTDNLTIEILKIRYNWFLNASVKNCIVGENENGLVWYYGEWVCGEWEGGTWYSGIWHDGVWKNGKWYSYLIDNVMALSRGLVIIENDKKYSEFRSGLWIQGDFYNGTFGYDRDVSNMTYGSLIGRTFTTAYWQNGKFHDGVFKNSVWMDGIFYDGDMTNSYWLNGKFYNGTFSQYVWYNGHWYGGDFEQGNWKTGIFDQINSSIKSRFGTDSTGVLNDYNRWDDGIFANGEFHSGLNLDASGNTLPSLNNKISQWFSGNFNGGKWFGGHFRNGNFTNSQWYGGVWNTNTGSTNYINCIWNSGDWFNGLWMNGTFKDGHFYNGLWLDGIFEYGYLSTNTEEGELLTKSLFVPVSLPTVVTNSATTITDISAYGNGRVTNNGGGTILDRGICWGVTWIDLTTGSTTNNRVSDGGSMGSFSILLDGLSSNAKYYFRAYARNKTGVTYGDIYDFTTTVGSGPSAPSVVAYQPPDNVISTDATFKGWANDNGSTITECGFWYDTTIFTKPPPVPGTAVQVISPDTITDYGFFTGDTSGSLTISTTYYYVAYATNAEGTSYSNVKTFTTPGVTPTAPTVLTTGVDNIYDTTAIGHGDVTSNGNASITERGICWNTTVDPTIADDKIIVFGTTGIFEGNITGLTPGTTYYARAYATNSVGTSYGTNVSFETKIAPTVILELIIAL